MERTQNKQGNWFFPLCVVVAFMAGWFTIAPTLAAVINNAQPTAQATDLVPVYISSSELMMPFSTSFQSDLSWALLPDPSFPSHAVMRHGVEALTASICNESNYELKFYNPETKRTAFFCRVDELFGIHIFDEAKKEVTAFIKNKMRQVDQVIKYMKNTGYELLQ